MSYLTIPHGFNPHREIDISGLVAHIDLFPVEGPPPSSTASSRSSESPSGIPDGFPSTPALPHGGQRPKSDGLSLPPNATTCTNAVFGSSFVHGVQMDWRGEPVVFFVFSDLSVRFEGYFCMRYRCFDLFR